jgi:NADPH-dependent curcumin reductase CurA
MDPGNKQVLYTSRPQGQVSADCFSVTDTAISDPKDGDVVIANKYLSLDPYMRMAMLGQQGTELLNNVMGGRVVGTIAQSRHAKFKEGDTVFAMGRWEQYSVLPGDEVRPIDIGNVGWTPFLSHLGFTGLTAWAGLEHYSSMQAGETIFVSAASGAVGSVVGQIAKIKGLRAVGCAGSDAKVDYLLNDLGFDAAFNYKTVDDLSAEIGRHCPDGVDIDFENVGGRIFDAVFRNMKLGGRLLICGGISQYNLETPDKAVPNLLDFITKQLTMRGFTVRNHADEIETYISQARDWVMNGQLKGRETVVQGIANAPGAFVGLFQGDNFGKLIIRVDG